MIDMQEMLHDPDFCSLFTVTRKKSEWVEGEQISSTSSFITEGIVLP